MTYFGFGPRIGFGLHLGLGPSLGFGPSLAPPVFLLDLMLQFQGVVCAAVSLSSDHAPSAASLAAVAPPVVADDSTLPLSSNVAHARQASVSAVDVAADDAADVVC